MPVAGYWLGGLFDMPSVNKHNYADGRPTSRLGWVWQSEGNKVPLNVRLLLNQQFSEIKTSNNYCAHGCNLIGAFVSRPPFNVMCLRIAKLPETTVSVLLYPVTWLQKTYIGLVFVSFVLYLNSDVFVRPIRWKFCPFVKLCPDGI